MVRDTQPRPGWGQMAYTLAGQEWTVPQGRGLPSHLAVAGGYFAQSGGEEEMRLRAESGVVLLVALIMLAVVI